MTRARARIGGLAVAGAIVVVGLVGSAPLAAAHAQLESTSPSQGAVAATAPHQVVLHFGEPVEIDFGSVRVYGPRGARVDRGGTQHPPGDSHAVETTLPAALPHGTYVVAWHVISADSHPVHGAFEFSVGSPSSATRADAEASRLAGQSGSAVVGIVYWFVRAAAFVGLVLLVGVAAVAGVVWPAGAGVARVRRLLWASWLVLMLSTVAGIALQGVYASQLPLTDLFRPSLITDVLHTHFGRVELVRLGLLVVAVPVMLAVEGRIGQAFRRWWLPVGAAVGLGLLATPGLAGHAATGTLVALGIATDLVHLGGVSLWLGGLAVLGALLVRTGPGDGEPPDLRPAALRISSVAFWAVVAVVASGVVQAIRLVGSFYGLFHTTYGVTLLVKVGLVCVLVALGAVSRRIVHGDLAIPWISRRRSAPPAATAALDARPAGRQALAVQTLDAPPADGPPAPLDVGSRRQLRRSVVAEVLVALAVLAVTALLVNAAPAKEVVAQPYSGSFHALGLEINVVIDPARAGPGNVFHVYVLDSSGALKAVPELDVAMSLPSKGIGSLAVPLVVTLPGHYEANQVDIPFAGSWHIDITLRTTAIDEEEVGGTVPIH